MRYGSTLRYEVGDVRSLKNQNPVTDIMVEEKNVAVVKPPSVNIGWDHNSQGPTKQKLWLCNVANQSHLFNFSVMQKATKIPPQHVLMQMVLD